MSHKTLEDRFWEKVIVQEGCWDWTAYKDRWGYGWMKMDNRNKGAHVISHVIHLGPVPEGMKVMHSCDNPSCTNPKHLSLGTHADNMADMAAKGRGRNWCTDVTHCKHDHELTDTNTYWWKDRKGSDHRGCKKCRQQRGREFRERRAKRLSGSGEGLPPS